MLAKARCKNVQPVNADFLTVSPDDPKYNSVTHMYVRPFNVPLLDQILLT